MKTFTDIAKPWVGKLASYEPGRPLEEVARELGLKSADDIVKLASNENALGPSPKAISAMKKAAGQMHLYPDGGAFYLRQALAKKLGVPTGQIIMGSGSNELLEFMGHVFLEKGANIVISQCAFIVYKLVAAEFQADVIEAPMKDFGHDLDAMLKAITPRTRIVYIANPNNPTGTMVDQDALDRFMSRVPDHVVVGIDEAYIELLPPAKQPDCLQYIKAGRKVVLFRTFSKAYGLAGLRLGYAIAAEDCIRFFNCVRQPFNVTSMALSAGLAALGDAAHVAKTREMVRDGLAYFEDQFRKMKLAYVPSLANFMLVKVGSGRKVFEAMQREKVIVRPVDGYGLPDYVRITVGTPRENERCIKAMKKVLGR